MPASRHKHSGGHGPTSLKGHASGQAMIEFVIAILLVVIILTGILQFVEVAGIKGVMLASIRSEAGERALSRLTPLSTTPTYILDWQAGQDEIRHTADDTYSEGISGNTLRASTIDRSARQESDWAYLAEARNSDIPRIHASALPMSALGFVHAELREEVPLLPAMRDWLLGKESITVGTELWLPRLHLEGFE